MRSISDKEHLTHKCSIRWTNVFITNICIKFWLCVRFVFIIINTSLPKHSINGILLQDHIYVAAIAFICFSSIRSYKSGLILHNISSHFFLFLPKFSCFPTLCLACEKRPFLFNVRYRQAYVSSRSSGFSFGSGRRHYFGNSSVDQEVASQSMSECGAIRRLEIGYCHSCVIFTIALFFLNLLLPDFQAFGGQWFANVIGQQHVPPDQLVWSFYQCRLV